MAYRRSGRRNFIFFSECLRPMFIKKQKLCKCGCGNYANIGKKFIWGHNTNPSKGTGKKAEINFCQCGCGKQLKPYRRFIKGHELKCRPAWNKGLTKIVDKSMAKISQSLLGNTPWNKNKKMSEDLNRRNSETQKRLWKDSSYRKNNLNHTYLITKLILRH